MNNPERKFRSDETRFKLLEIHTVWWLILLLWTTMKKLLQNLLIYTIIIPKFRFCKNK